MGFVYLGKLKKLSPTIAPELLKDTPKMNTFFIFMDKIVTLL